MTVVFALVLGMLSASAVLTVLRVFRGPSTLDRIAALDTFVVLLVAGAAVFVAVYLDSTAFPLMAAVALVGFVGTATAARLVERWERHR